MPRDGTARERLSGVKRPLAALLALALAVPTASFADETLASPPLDAPAPPPEPEAPPPPSVAVPRLLPGPAQNELRRTLNERPSPPSAGEILVATETLFVVNSYLASIAPRIYGGAGLVLLPAGLAGMEAGPERAASFVFVEALALYNLLGVDTARQSEGDVFRANLLAWHGILALNAVIHGVVQRRAKRRELALVPLRRGAGARLCWRF